MPDNVPPPAHAPNLGGPPLSTVIPPHSFLIWNRLGPARRCNNASTQYYDPLIHQRFRQSKIQVVMLPPKSHEANPTWSCFKALCKPENVIKGELLGEEPRHGPGANFRGVKLSVSKVLGRLHFNTAAFRGWYKAQPTGRHLQNRWNRPILSQEDLSDVESPKKQLKKLSYFSGQISYRLF